MMMMIIIIYYYNYYLLLLLYMYIYPDYHTIRISEQGVFNRWSHMFIYREGPTQSSIAKHFLGNVSVD
jgi:hypothetical protein